MSRPQPSSVQSNSPPEVRRKDESTVNLGAGAALRGENMARYATQGSDGGGRRVEGKTPLTKIGHEQNCHTPMPATVIVVTGSSRGYGRSLACAFARQFSGVEGVHVVLISRGEKGLMETKTLVESAAPGVTVHVVPMDLGALDSIAATWEEKVVDGALKGVAWARGILINNAGSPGPISYIRDMGLESTGPTGVSALRATLDLDIASPIILSSLFLKALQKGGAPGSPPSVVVNVSSLAAVAPFASLGLYSITRAAKDMLHRVIGEEGGGGVLTLNYAPGPMDSELQVEIRNHPDTHGPTKAFFKDMEAKNTWVDKDVSAALCAKLVGEGAFKDGEHLDFYDVSAAAAAAAAAEGGAKQ